MFLITVYNIFYGSRRGMSKLTIIGDPHAKPTNLTLIFQLFEKVERLGNTTIWLGDFLDTKEIVRGKCFNLIYKLLKMSKLQHIVIVGNHDWFNLECKDHSLLALKELPNVRVIDKPTSLHHGYFIPYIHDQDELKNVLKQLPKGSTLFAHLELKGFDYGNGHICKSGLTTRSLSRFRRVISGHFHKYQEKGNFTYLGTPFSHTFGESNQQKYFGIYDTETDHLELVDALFRRHITLEYNCDTNSVNPREYTVASCDTLRVILTGSWENINLFNKSSFYEGAKYIERPNDDFQKGVQIDETLDNVVKFKTWAKDIKDVDQETIDLGAQILEAIK